MTNQHDIESENLLDNNNNNSKNNNNSQADQDEISNDDNNNNVRSKEIKIIILSLGSILIYYCFSILLTFYNRHIFVKFNYPLSITMVHLIFKFVLSGLIRTIYNLCNVKSKKRILLDWSTYLRKIVPTGAASATDIGFSNWSLQYITITLYTMSKSTAILFIFFFSILFKLEKWRRSILGIVLCISIGLVLFTYHSTQFHLFGFILVMIASFMAGIRWTLTQTVTQKHELGLSNPIDMIFHIQPSMILFLLPLAVGIEGKSLYNSIKFFQSNDSNELINNIFSILIGAALAFVLEASEYLVVTYTSSLTLSISGIFKEICVIFLAVEINNNKLTPINTLGLVIVLFGISVHVYQKARREYEMIKPKHGHHDNDSLSNRLNLENNDGNDNQSNKTLKGSYDDDEVYGDKKSLDNNVDVNDDDDDEVEIFSANKKLNKLLYNFNGSSLTSNKSIKSESFSLSDQQQLNEPLLKNEKN